ncbi:MAG: ribosomal-processing cysteine protease Prp [Treponema sp.]|jgi:uncharacterized protein YsxB (DUF464 family)|nr:ribosomal-processing cysteine protease Prp [Treponema sp.]
MIEIEAILEDDGTLRACRASGHAGAGKAGTDIVCAAVSVLMRTAFNVLSGRKNITVRGGAPEKGQLWLEADYEADGKDFLFAAGVFLIEGLSSVAKEYPQNCRLNISTQPSGLCNERRI